MDNKYNYDFSGLETAMSHLRHNQNQHILNEIRNELNKFFKDSECVDVIFTRNTDKMFFGMCTMAILDGEKTAKILMDDKPERITSYYLEIDSKLIDNMNLSKEELTAVILHEVGHLVNDSTPIDEVRHAIDNYMMSTGDVLAIKDSIHFKEVLAYALKDSLRKITSLFTRNDDEILADEFVFMCGYGEYLESAFKKITSSASTINRGVSNKLIVLDWTLRLYKSMKFQRISAIATLNKMKRFTASKLEKREIETLTRSLQKIDDIALQEASYILEDASNKISLTQRIQRSGLKSIEEDIFEYEMRIRNVEDEDDALFILRGINMRMSLLDDYLSSDIDDKDRERWQRVFDRFDRLREELSKKTVYFRKNYGLWANYNYMSDMYR
jgi:hypothetical protein